MIVSAWQEKDSLGDIDLFVAAVGYEARSRFILDNNAFQAQQKTAFYFIDRQVLDFKKNHDAFQNSGFALIPSSQLEIRRWWETWFNDYLRTVATPNVVIDISCMTREMIALIVFLLAKLSRHLKRVVHTTFLYAPAKYSNPPTLRAPIMTKGPVIPELAGWSPPALPTTVVFGIGYEPDLALGVLEDFEPRIFWVFRPSGHDERYTKAINKVNKTFIEVTPAGCEISYPVLKPIELFTSLESLVHGALQRNRVVLVPLGPKIFALSSMLVSMIHFPRVAVWRVSSGPYSKPVNRHANGSVVGVDVTFAATQVNETSDSSSDSIPAKRKTSPRTTKK